MSSLLLFVLVSLLFLLGVLVEAIIRGRSQSKASAWPVTPGTVEDTAGRASRGRADPAAVIHYSYSVEGQQYSGSYHRPFLSETDVGVFLARFLRGTKLRVHYNPLSPKDSQLSDQELDHLIVQAEE